MPVSKLISGVSMPSLRFVAGMLSVAQMALGAGAAYGQAFPSKPVRIITTQAGGSNDLIARLIAQGIASSLGQQVIVENRPSGPLSGQLVQQAPPDGHTILGAGTTFAIST